MIYPLAVFGNPIAHSRSPEIHARFAEQHGLAIDYSRLLVPVGEFDRYATRFLETGGHGFNVTLPFKQDAFQFCDQCTSGAEMAGAVNTVSRSDDRIVGANTDGPGLVRDLIGNLGWELGGKRLLVLGAGGAVQGVIKDLLLENPTQIHILNRTKARADSLVLKLGDERVIAVVESDLEHAYDVVVNATSAGLKGEPFEIPESAVDSHSRCYDMSYGAEPTSFMQWGTANGCLETSDGLGMLVEQAARAFSIWFGVEVATHDVIETLRGKL